jgi:LmbE family N-acetylglucosaminyl deacetylase
VGRNKDINLVEISQWVTPVHTKIDVEAYLPHKLAASQAHASQYSGGPAYIRVLPKFLRQRFLATENYTRAFPAPSAVIEYDLFAGIV